MSFILCLLQSAGNGGVTCKLLLKVICLQKTLYLNKMVNNFLFFALLLLFRQNSVHSAFVE